MQTSLHGSSVTTVVPPLAQALRDRYVLGKELGRGGTAAGQFVFTADTPMGLLLKHAQAPPTPPSARTDLPIPKALDDLVLKLVPLV